ncbi:diaminopimelate epimerase [Shimazuella sp. AN120528]|uniref:diaminopimelate epimerase n=1 Tax=Shimazuella soli TaxID=1892854 RepID=UPI001F1127E8|nr:diaminopimelate epimerase [Shimazuella soli]MCH5584790.1 diaminopimelate epimerase [Shimazuella soli]
MKFHKMHGLGNDFVIVQAEDQVPDHVSELAVQVCDRHTGIGADGLVFILPSEKADFQMRIFNADGTEAQQCGNAVRCVSKYYYERMDNSKTNILVETKRDVQPIVLQVKAGIVTRVQVDMGEPILVPSQIPVKSQTIHDQVVIGETIYDQVVIKEQAYAFTAVSMGNPHAVIEVDTLSDELVKGIGPKIERSEVFPEKANIEFINIVSPEEITMRVWERGVGETMACGSGACAVLVASHLNGKASRKATVHLLGGDLLIDWNESDNHVYMTGPAEFVFAGEFFTAS